MSSLLPLVCALALQDPTPASDEPAGEASWFARRIEPVLAEHCYGCHGERDRGGLRLTSREAMLRGGDSGPVIELRALDESLLLEMIAYTDEEHAMPPAGKLPDETIALLTEWVMLGAPHDVAEDEIGAEPVEKLGPKDGLEGWSYAPIERPELPALRDASWPRTSIDHFLLARLEAAELPAPAPASPAQQVRRLHHDLLGFPPAPETLSAFEADPSDEAWRALVDELLDRPEYGQRWARHWLDVVRYAETNGYERDSDKPFMWRYRDWVVDALNADLPYDEFVRQQLAGDELEEVTPESLTATGFYRLMQWDDEPGQGRLQARYDVLADLVDVTASGFLGMSMGCARCHTHKADPIPHEDYYRFMAVFHGLTDMSVNGHLADITPAEQIEANREEKERRMQLARAARDERDGIERRLFAALASSGEPFGGRGDLIELRYRFYRDSWDALPRFDSLLAEDAGTLPGGRFDLSPATRNESIGFVFEGRLPVVEAGLHKFRMRAVDGARWHIGEHQFDAGRGRPGELALELAEGEHEVRLDWYTKRGPAVLAAEWTPRPQPLWHYSFEAPPEDWNAADFDASAWAQGEPGFGRPGTPGAVLGTEWTSDDVWMVRDFEWREGDELVFAVHHDEDVHVWINGVHALHRGGYRHNYELFDPNGAGRDALRPGTNRIAVHGRNSNGGQYAHVEPVPRRLAGSLAPRELAFGWVPLTALNEAGDQREIERVVRERAAALLGQEALERWEALGREIEGHERYEGPRVQTPAAQEQRDFPPMNVHVRGSAHNLGERIEPGVPSCVGGEALEPWPQPEGRRTHGYRRALAEWIVDPANPLTARVAVNRMWQHHFGRGLVGTPNDFGQLGERPSHPLLLDWLASELVRLDWSLKALHRELLCSAAYRASSVASERALELDPLNALWSRFPMRRMTAEEVRDSVLWLAGRLDTRLGGAPFYAIMPAEVRATASRPNAAWGNSPEQERWRRSLYIKVKRSLRTPVLDAFDLADTDNTCPERFTTTTPIQALELLDGDFVHHHLGAIVERLRADAGEELEALVRRGLELALARSVDAEEVSDHVQWIHAIRDEFGLSEEESLRDFALLLVNLNEFAYVD